MGVLADALSALAKADCPVLLIGGNALPAFGISRATVDVDCLIATDSTEKLKAVLAANGFPHAGRMFSFHEFWHHGNPADPPIHAMFVDSATFEKMWSAASRPRFPACHSGCHALLISLRSRYSR